MSNIFTFDFDNDDEQIVQSQQSQLEQVEGIKYEQIEYKKQEQGQKEKNKIFQFQFDEFEEELPQQNAKREVFRDLKEIKNKHNTKTILSKHSKFNKTFQEKIQNQNENYTQPRQFKEIKGKKEGNEIMAGLQIEDLGTNDMEYVNEKKALRVTDMRKFLHTPLGDYKVKAIIRKQGGGLLNLNSKYNVYIEQNNRFLFNITRDGLSQYIFSLDKNSSQKKKNYLGKMIGNMAGTQFLLFDSGFSPKETRSLEFCRKQLASIKYSTSSGPRKFTTIVSTNCQGFYALEPEQNILQQKWQKKERDYLSILHSKSPQFDPQDGNYKLDFKGVVKKASVKNFILGGVEWEDSLIFGKIDDDVFMLEIKEPLSVLQAAAICISSIHYKFNYWR